MTQTSIDYEERDLPLRGLFVWTVGLFGALAGILAVVYALYGTPTGRPEAELVQTRPMNQPVLQPLPQNDLRVFREKQKAHLSSYGWVDRAKGTVHLPIDRAIDLVLEKGLPARAGAEQ